jgi:hypothetical protein
MAERTCPICGTEFTPRAPNQKYCTGAKGKCYRAAMNASYRSVTETVACAHCGGDFARTRGTARRVYCTDECHHAAKRERYRGPVKARATWPPAETRTAIADYRRAVRADPCAYCGDKPANGIDHIEPTGNTGDRSDWTNWIGCCKRCNETKRTLPLLLALPWIPISRRYHDERRRLFQHAA